MLAVLSRYRSIISPNVPAWAYAAFLVVALGWVYVVPNFWVFLGAAACLLAIAALGLTVLVGWAGEVSLAQAALVGTSVYITGYMVRDDGYGLPFLVAAAAGIVVATALHSFVALATAKLSGIYIMVLTLGLQVTIERTIFTYSNLTGGPEGVYQLRPKFLGVSFESDRAFYYLAFAALVGVIALLTLFRQSRHGRALLLVRTNREAAAAVGISPWRYKILAFAICGALAGVAGALTSPLYRSPPTALQYLSIPSLFMLAVPVTAGFESLLAVVLVAFSFTMIPQALEAVHVSPFVVGGVGLLTGTYIGARGIGGAFLDRLRERREAAILRAVATQPATAEVPAPARTRLPPRASHGRPTVALVDVTELGRRPARNGGNGSRRLRSRSSPALIISPRPGLAGRSEARPRAPDMEVQR